MMMTFSRQKHWWFLIRNSYSWHTLIGSFLPPPYLSRSLCFVDTFNTTVIQNDGHKKILTDYSEAKAGNVKDPYVISRLFVMNYLNIIMTLSHPIQCPLLHIHTNTIDCTVRSAMHLHSAPWNVALWVTGVDGGGKKITFGPRNDTFGFSYRYFVFIYSKWMLTLNI